MADCIEVVIDKNHNYVCGNKVLGRLGENICTKFEITLPTEFVNKWVYLEFRKPDGTTYLTPKLTVVEGKVTYDVPLAILDKVGNLSVDVILKDSTGWTWVTTIKDYRINKSINASEEIPDKEDFITEAQKLLEEIEEGLTPTIGANGNWFVGDNDTGVKAQGPKGNTGDTGQQGQPGTNGTDGEDGYSPTATVNKVGSTATISITDKDGTTTATVSDGANGQDGADGEDGISPTVTISKTGKVTTITITDAEGTHTATINDGEDGQSAAAIWGSITGTLSNQTDLQTALDGKVSTEQGKGLSTNDYTTAEKTKLEGVEAGAEVNDVTDVQINGTSIVSSGVANIPIASQSSLGAVKTYLAYGTYITSTGNYLAIEGSTNAEIIARTNTHKPIVPSNLDYAVRSVIPEVITTNPATLAVNKIYDLGTQSSLSLTLPAGAVGNFIEVQFISGATPTTLTITSTSGMSETDINPEANTIYSIFFEWLKLDSTNYGWGISYTEYVKSNV